MVRAGGHGARSRTGATFQIPGSAIDRAARGAAMAQFTGARSDQQAHVEQEEREHALLQVGEGHHRLLAVLAGQEADQHAAEQQEVRAVGERLVQHLAHGHRLGGARHAGVQRDAAAARRQAARGLRLGACTHIVREQHRHDDGGRLHQHQGDRHVAARCEALLFGEGLRGDEGHRADRAVGRRDGGGVEGVQTPPQHRERPRRHGQRQQEGRQQRPAHRRREPGRGEAHASLEPDDEQQVERAELGRCGRDLEIGPDRPGKDAEEEQQDRGVDQRDEERGVHVRPVQRRA